MKSKLFLLSLVAVSSISLVAMADDTVPVQPVSDPAPVADVGVDPLPPPAPLPPVQQTTVVEAPSPVVVQPVPVAEEKPTNPANKFRLGMFVDLSIPSGVAAGVQTRLPYLPWFKLGLGLTETLAPGIRGNLLIDPISFPIAPVANFDLGHQFGFNLPGVENSPNINFTYEDFQIGGAVGSRDGFRFMILGGTTHLSGVAHNFQGVIHNSPTGLTIADPNFSGWTPSVKLGVEFLF